MQREQLARQKEKEDDAKAKKAIKDKLEQDRRERIAQAEARSGKTATATVVQEQQPVTSTTEKKEYTKCAIQIRFQSGNNIRASFSPEDTLQTGSYFDFFSVTIILIFARKNSSRSCCHFTWKSPILTVEQFS